MKIRSRELPLTPSGTTHISLILIAMPHFVLEIYMDDNFLTVRQKRYVFNTQYMVPQGSRSIEVLEPKEAFALLNY